MGVNSNMDILYANQNIKTTPNWTGVPGKLKNISYSNGQAYGVNDQNQIFYCADYKSGKWDVVPGGLSQISFESK